MLDKKQVANDLKALFADLQSTKDKNVAFMKLIGYVNKIKQQGGK